MRTNDRGSRIAQGSRPGGDVALSGRSRGLEPREDFGKGQLDCGQADVTLDPDFAAAVHLDEYHVFLTQYGGHDDLSVSDQTPRGFRVEAKDANASGRFSWRVVAKRKDIASPRFEPVTVPPQPEMPTIPDPPAKPTPPVMRRHH